jgi:DNA invertase Pin-like site-specific DNA recombinase
MSRKNLTPAIAYLRTSSAVDVGTDGDSDKRQRAAIEAFAKHAGFELVGEYCDQTVSDADPIEGRPGFKALLDRIVSNGVNTVIVEDASRFARTLMVQEAGIAMLVGLGVQVMTSRGDDLTDSDEEMRVAMRQIVGVFSQLEKTRHVKKLKAARERKKASGIGRHTGRKSHVEKHPDVVAEAKRLYRANPKTGERRSLREISAQLEDAGFLNEFGKPYHPQSIQRMLEGNRPPREVIEK